MISDGETVHDLARRSGYHDIATQLDALTRRAHESRFHVAVIGQFKRGKSTLVNALLGADLLPTGVAPVTSVVTLLRWGAHPRITVHHRGSPAETASLDRLGDFITEAGNPENRREIALVEIEWPCELLHSGLCLVDTPGVGSTVAANTKEAHAFVPQIDAAVVVLGIDPPISGPERELLLELAVEPVPLVVVVNKADVARSGDLAAGIDFSRRILADALGTDPPLVALSARQAREGESLPDGRVRGGVDDLVAMLRDLADRRGAALARTALARGERRLLVGLLQALQAEHQALSAPVERIADAEKTLGRQLDRIYAFADGLPDRLRGGLERFRRQLEERRDEFIGQVKRRARVLAHEACPPADHRRREVQERALWERVEALLGEWEAATEEWATERLQDLRDRLVGELLGFLSEMRSVAGAYLGGLDEIEAPAPRFVPASRHYFAPDRAASLFDEGSWLAEWWPIRRRARRLARLEALAGSWAAHNATRMAADMAAAAADASRPLQAELAEAAREYTATTRQALEKAMATRAAGQTTIAERLDELESLLWAGRRLVESGLSPRNQQRIVTVP
jgi:hypothetical protein